MSSTKRLLLASVVILSFSSVAIMSVLAQGGAPQGPPQGQGFGPHGRGPMGPPPGGGPGLALERLDRELGFSDDQRTQIQAVLKDEHDANKATLDSLFQAQQALDAAIMQVPADQNLVQTRVAELTAIQAQAALAHAQSEARIFQLLNGDQQQKAQQWLQTMAQRRPQRGAGGPGGK